MVKSMHGDSLNNDSRPLADANHRGPKVSNAREEAAALARECNQQGLDGQLINDHRAKIKGILSQGGHGITFPVLDTCRLDNGRLLAQAPPFAPPSAPPIGSKDTTALLKHFVAFIPAAGASSRYSTPLAPLMTSLQTGDREQLRQALAALQPYRSLLPAPLKKLLLAGDTQLKAFPPSAQEQLLTALRAPKALYPCMANGMTFLALKCHEHEQLAGLGGQVFITPPGEEKRFAAQVHGELGPLRTPLTFMEQGMELSTIRFDRQGEPVRDKQGRLSPVPAGHGALVKLFPRVAQAYPSCHSMFIRNIDNVNGTGEDVQQATIAFLALHHRILTSIGAIRQFLRAEQWIEAAAVAQSLSASLGLCRPLTPSEAAFLAALESPPQRSLWQLQSQLFQSALPGQQPASAAAPSHKDEALAEKLKELYERPVNTMGQVPNTGHDVGGTPVVIATAQGPLAVCLELPHVNESDRQHFYLDPKKATHFNPVFVASELVKDAHFYEGADHDFWILALKTWLGKDVAYVETVLYELLGNSGLANPVFVEIPRCLFNPHKSLDDTAGQQNLASQTS